MSRPRDPTDLQGQQEYEEEQQLLERARREQQVADIRWLMAHAEGRRIVWRLLEHAGVYRTSFTGNSGTFFNEGRRDVGLFLLSEVHEASVQSYVKMLKEHWKRKDDDGIS